jgi:hypothetical protein
VQRVALEAWAQSWWQAEVMAQVEQRAPQVLAVPEAWLALVRALSIAFVPVSRR